ncbi:MAG: hypothetical protein GTO55_12070 [Armatimonadetes bacterium]|nr:hypothetical protein [Armatimonadota bacterium]NIM24949.1 hypothetical protein [Armatimonadota bacterium]NIM68835.1 hypothetical protein [Armatimonadota bacterium]NIM76661.1 hypothetical protein [Armatimonadota bacterium]NIN07040.1 hypothetical protein [Armatimonadota bacterium]
MRKAILRKLPDLLVLAAILIILYLVLHPIFTDPPPRTFSLTQMSESLYIVFPRSACLEESVLEGARALDLYAKVTIDQEDVKWFMEQGFSKAAKTKPVFIENFVMFKGISNWEDMRPHDKKIASWWKPRSVKRGLGARIDLVDKAFSDEPPDRWLEVIIDQNRGEQAIVYLYASF